MHVLTKHPLLKKIGGHGGDDSGTEINMRASGRGLERRFDVDKAVILRCTEGDESIGSRKEDSTQK